MSAEWLSAVKLDKIMQNKELCDIITVLSY